MMRPCLRTLVPAASILLAGLSGTLQAEDYAISSVAGNPNIAGATDGSGTVASFNNPFGIAIDAAKNLYVADTVNKTIRKITPDRTVSTLAGLAGQVGSTDGTGS